MMTGTLTHRLATLADDTGNSDLYEKSHAIELIMEREYASKGIYPNVDFYSATTYHCIGLKLDLFRSYEDTLLKNTMVPDHAVLIDAKPAAYSLRGAIVFSQLAKTRYTSEQLAIAEAFCNDS